MMILTIFSVMTILTLSSMAAANAIGGDYPAVSLSKPAIVTDSRPISELAAGEQVFIKTTVVNQEKFDRSFAAITEVFDSQDITESIGIVTGSISVGNSVTVGMIWIPSHAGIYKLKTFALSDLEIGDVLANPGESIVTIVLSHNTTLSKLKVAFVPTSQPRIDGLFVGVNVTDVQGNPVVDATVSVTISNSSYDKTFSGQTNSSGIWTFWWDFPFDYKSRYIDVGFNIRASASKYGYEDGSTEVNVPIVT